MACASGHIIDLYKGRKHAAGHLRFTRSGEWMDGWMDCNSRFLWVILEKSGNCYCIVSTWWIEGYMPSSIA